MNSSTAIDSNSLAAEDPEGLIQGREVVDPHRPRRPRPAARFEDQREADLGGKGMRFAGAGHRGRSGGRHARRPQRFLHGRFVPAQPGRMDRSPRDRARLTHLRGGHDVRLDRGLEPVHPQLVLHPADRAGHGLHVGDRRHLLVVVQPALQLIVETADGVLADADHRRARLGQRPGEFPLVSREPGLDENHVHAWNGSSRQRSVNLGSPPRRVSGLIEVWPIALSAVPATGGSQ